MVAVVGGAAGFGDCGRPGVGCASAGAAAPRWGGPALGHGKGGERRGQGPEGSSPVLCRRPALCPSLCPPLSSTKAQTLSSCFSVPEARRVMEWPEAHFITHRQRKAIRAGRREPWHP